jgi:hypothetical protein
LGRVADWLPSADADCACAATLQKIRTTAKKNLFAIAALAKSGTATLTHPQNLFVSPDFSLHET